MAQDMILTLICDDKPGVVETLSHVINDHTGNWLESRLSHLAGKFAGIIRIQLADINHKAQLLNALEALEGFNINITDVASNTNTAECKTLHFNLVGNDRPGIIRELSQAFAKHHINVDELHTGCSSMPWSGEPMFTAQGTLTVPPAANLDQLQDELDEISDELGVDINLDEAETEQA